MKDRGIPAVLTQANCEPLYADAHSLVFYAEGTPCVGLDFGEGEIVLGKDALVHGVEVRFVGRSEALSLLTGGEPPCEKPYTAEEVTGFSEASLPARRTVTAEAGVSFDALGITEGLAEYEVETAGRELFIEHPCDMLRVTEGGVRGQTLFADGRDVILPAAKDGKYLVEIEKWGNCNFDDPQSPALRTAGKKGALSFGAAVTEKVNRCDFSLLDTFGAEEISLEQGIPVRIGINKWNSTRKPVNCAYTLRAERRAERLLLKTTEACEVAVYVDGRKAGVCDFGTFELTDFFRKGETRTLTVVYRKLVWTQDCGSLRLLHVDPIAPKRVRVRTAAELTAMKRQGGAVSLPLRPVGEKALCIRLSFPREGYLRFVGKDVKLTCVAGGRVVGRCLVGWRDAPRLEGGAEELLYICPSWNGTAYLLAEALGGDACLERVEMLTVR